MNVIDLLKKENVYTKMKEFLLFSPQKHFKKKLI